MLNAMKAKSEKKSVRNGSEGNMIVDVSEVSRALQIRNNANEQNVRERKSFARLACILACVWFAFLIFLIIAQMVMKHSGLGLSEGEFIAVVTTTTLYIFGFPILVGKYLFR